MRESEINRMDDPARDGKLNKRSHLQTECGDQAIAQETEFMERHIRSWDLDKWIARAAPRFIFGEVPERNKKDDGARVQRWLDLADCMLASDFHLLGSPSGDA